MKSRVAADTTRQTGRIGRRLRLAMTTHAHAEVAVVGSPAPTVAHQSRLGSRGWVISPRFFGLKQPQLGSREWFSLHRFFGLKRTAVALAAVAMGVAGLVTVGASPAAAASGFSVRLVPYSNPFLFVEVAGASGQPGAGIIQWSYNGGSNQVWTLRPSGNDYVIVNRGSGQCLTTDGVAGGWLFQWPCNDSPRQQWRTSLAPGNDTAYTIKNPSSGLYLDVEGGSGWQGAHLVGWYRTGANNQYFLGHSVA